MKRMLGVAGLAIGAVLAGSIGAAAQDSLGTRYGDIDDVCYAERQPLVQTRSQFLKTWIYRNYFSALRAQSETREQLLAEIDADASRDNRELTATGTALDRLVACRQNEIGQVAALYRVRSITAAQAKSAYRMIAARMVEDGELINAVLGTVNERAATYVSARAQILSLTQSGNPPPRAAPSRAHGSEALARAKGEIEAKEAAHRQLRQMLQQRIDELAAATG
jgi:hypothetical protein